MPVSSIKYQCCPQCGGTGSIPVRFDPEELIRAVALFAGDRTFNARELMTYALLVEGPLRNAIGPLSTKQLGKALRKMMNKSFGGFVIERQGVDSAGARWRVFFRHQ